jgi:hypothetical protein
MYVIHDFIATRENISMYYKWYKAQFERSKGCIIWGFVSSVFSS